MKKHLIAVAERSIATFVFTFGSIATLTNLNDAHALEVGALAGGLSVLKYLATQAGLFLNTK